MMTFLRKLIDGSKPITQIKAENFLSRESLGIEPYPEDPKASVIMAGLWQELKALPFDHNRSAVTIEVSKSANETIIDLENERARHMRRPMNEWPIYSGQYSLYGYRVRVVSDESLNGKDARVVYEVTL